MKRLTIILGAIAVLLAILVLQHEREHRAAVAQQTEANKLRAQEWAPAPSVWRDPPNAQDPFVDLSEEAKAARRHMK